MGPLLLSVKKWGAGLSPVTAPMYQSRTKNNVYFT
jgi:hypothetical protein